MYNDAIHKARQRRLTITDDAERCEAWTHPVGTPVVVTKDDGSEVRTKTRSAPWMLCGTAVILLEGISGGYALCRVRVG
jgi:hypothetical protein